MAENNLVVKEKKVFNRKEYNDQYYQKNKSVKSICELCGGKTSPFNKYQHEQSAKHQKKLKESTTPTLEQFTKMLIDKSSELGIKVEIKDKSLIIG
jgi:epoxyqueuosine reductase QueG